MGGVMAEVLELGAAEGGGADLAQLDGLMASASVGDSSYFGFS